MRIAQCGNVKEGDRLKVISKIHMADWKKRIFRIGDIVWATEHSVWADVYVRDKCDRRFIIDKRCLQLLPKQEQLMLFEL